MEMKLRHVTVPSLAHSTDKWRMLGLSLCSDQGSRAECDLSYFKDALWKLAWVLVLCCQCLLSIPPEWYWDFKSLTDVGEAIRASTSYIRHWIGCFTLIGYKLKMGLQPCTSYRELFIAVISQLLTCYGLRTQRLKTIGFCAQYSKGIPHFLYPSVQLWSR